MARVNWRAVGTTSLALAIAAGAFGTHALRGSIPVEQLQVFQTAQSYHVTGSLAVLAFEALGAGRSTKWVFCGLVVFSGSLYLLALTGARWWGMVTPVGGALMIGGLLCQAYAWSTQHTEKTPSP